MGEKEQRVFEDLPAPLIPPGGEMSEKGTMGL